MLISTGGQCLEAGVDDCLTKPVNPKALIAALENRIATLLEKVNGQAMAPVQPFCFDSHELLERVFGDRELLKEIVDLFFDNTHLPHLPGTSDGGSEQVVSAAGPYISDLLAARGQSPVRSGLPQHSDFHRSHTVGCIVAAADGDRPRAVLHGLQQLGDAPVAGNPSKPLPT